MATVLELQAQRELLLTKLTTSQRVQFGDRSIEERAIAEIRAAIAIIDGEIVALADAALATPRSRISRVMTSKGLD